MLSPVDSPLSPTGVDASQSRTQASRRPSVLVVDDSEEIRLLITALLSSQNYAVTCAESGKVALTILKRDNFDLLITDVLMPEIDGLELILRLRKEGYKFPVVAMSGGGHYMSSFRCLDLAEHLGAHCALTKPFTAADFFAAVNAMLRGAHRQ